MTTPCIVENQLLKYAFIIIVLACSLLSGCAGTNFANSPTPVSIKEEWIRKELTVWGGTRIFAVGDMEFGYLRYDSDATFTVDPGRKRIKMFYYANRGNAQGLFWQTDIVSLDAELKPNGRYQVRGDYEEAKVRFRLVDLETEQVIAESDEAPIVRRPSPAQESPNVIPLFIP